MKTTKRFDMAVQKLYTAFHENTLNPECCTACAVGNILDNNDVWKNFTDCHGSSKLTYVGQVNEAFGKRFNGYTPAELLNIEAIFLGACGFKLPLMQGSKRPINPTDPNILFNGLEATIDYLCRIDGIENIMDYSKIFIEEVLKKNETTSQVA